MKKNKTNAMRILDKEKIKYSIHTYPFEDDKIDGLSVANKIGRAPAEVYKTLVSQGNSNSYFVFVVPVDVELDLKKAAKAVGEKRIEMIPVKDIQKVTGYIRGGCSPIGMKKPLPTYIANKAEELDTIIVSGGMIGIQIEIEILDLIKVTHGGFANL
ncbi:Cys-tRNA(Pro) deacylase [Litchfieldia salsa]|uniref:Cys-tRNA(Pro)/Cys-tRNA(Cys) deacylase n=1 Tax=Litchfieldia salsa TaxID=930152 RepID=A0A1H0T725_9BACI|nr:Cys-tRNA(Pro) deacylase [Litchfieldia salsa]SDP49833.1 Cys-tRNA(Pro)/Cys-tRNA(Cys) deacylase [Litchfieldia salsa]